MDYGIIFIIAFVIGFVSMTAHDLGVRTRHSDSGRVALAGWMFTGVGWVGYVLAAGLLFILVMLLIEWCVDTRWSMGSVEPSATSCLGSRSQCAEPYWLPWHFATSAVKRTAKAPPLEDL